MPFWWGAFFFLFFKNVFWGFSAIVGAKKFEQHFMLRLMRKRSILCATSLFVSLKLSRR